MINILSIDDSKAVHAFIRSCLKDKAIELFDAFDGAAGLAFLEKNSNISLVLLDWEMPIKNGPETLVELRAKHPNILVIMLTSKNDMNEMIKMIELGASEYIMKPFTKEILIEKINMVLGSEI